MIVKNYQRVGLLSSFEMLWKTALFMHFTQLRAFMIQLPIFRSLNFESRNIEADDITVLPPEEIDFKAAVDRMHS